MHKKKTTFIFVLFSHFLMMSSGDMLDLLKWRAHPERINDSLSKLKEIDGSEIVKVGSRSYFAASTCSDLGSVCLFISLYLDVKI